MSGLSETIKALSKDDRAGIRTALPGIIESYDWKTRRANVLPTLSEKYADGKKVDLPVIPNAVVQWPRGHGCQIDMPLQRGDGGLIIFTARALERWLNSDGDAQVEPGDTRMHDLTDAIFVPGLEPYSVESLSQQPPGGAKGGEDVVLVYDAPGAAQRMELRLAKDGTLSATNTKTTITIAPDGTVNVVAGAAVNLTAVGSITFSSDASIALDAPEISLSADTITEATTVDHTISSPNFTPP